MFQKISLPNNVSGCPHVNSFIPHLEMVKNQMSLDSYKELTQKAYYQRHSLLHDAGFQRQDTKQTIKLI